MVVNKTDSRSASGWPPG